MKRAYLAEHLLSLEYEVHGLKRSSSSLNTERVITFPRSVSVIDS